MLILKILIPGKKRATYYIKEGRIILGSSKNSDVDIFIEDSTVSRKHCLIEKREGEWFVKDLNSKNGVIVNSEKVKEFKIQQEAKLFLGRVSLEVEIIEDEDGILENGKSVVEIQSKELEKTEELFFGPEISLLYMIKSLAENNSYLFFETVNKYLFDCDDILIGEKIENSEDFSVIFVHGDKKFLFDLIPNIDSLTDGYFYADSGKFFVLGRGNCKINPNLFSRLIDVYRSNFLCSEKERIEIKKEKFKSQKINKFNFVSKEMKKLIERSEKIAKTDINVIIYGESGVGKELLAKFIHENSKRHNAPFIAINCAAVPEALIEAELFGVEKGAATDTSERPGKFEMANGGTLFLDEISDTSLSLQAKLLRAIQFKEFYRVGGTQLKKVNVRIIVATNKNLKKLISEKKFRKDLYFRLAGDEISVPPLRDRREDIPELVNFFIKRFSTQYEKRIQGISNKAMRLLINYDYPGNVRELENEIERAVALVDEGDIIREAHLSERLKNNDNNKFKSELNNEWELSKIIEEVEKNHIITALNKFKNKTEVARALNISRTTLDTKIKKYGLEV